MFDSRLAKYLDKAHHLARQMGESSGMLGSRSDETVVALRQSSAIVLLLSFVYVFTIQLRPQLFTDIVSPFRVVMIGLLSCGLYLSLTRRAKPVSVRLQHRSYLRVTACVLLAILYFTTLSTASEVSSETRILQIYLILITCLVGVFVVIEPSRQTDVYEFMHLTHENHGLAGLYSIELHTRRPTYLFVSLLGIGLFVSHPASGISTSVGLTFVFLAFALILLRGTSDV